MTVWTAVQVGHRFLFSQQYLHKTPNFRVNSIEFIVLHGLRAAAILSAYLITSCVPPIRDFITVKPLFDATRSLDEDPCKKLDVLRLFAGVLVIVAVFALLVILLLREIGVFYEI